MLAADLVARVRRIEIRTRRLAAGTISGEYASAFRGRGMEFSDVREYMPGDDIRGIDWNVTARMGAPFIKRFVEERELCIVFLADLSGSMAFGSGAERKRETAALFAAAVGLIATRNKDKVGLATFTDRIETFIPPKRGRVHVLRAVREILAGEAVGRGTDLVLAMDHAMRAFRRHAVIFILSDFLGTGYERVLSRLGRKHDVIAVTVHDPLEAELPPVGLVDVTDPETGRPALIDTASASVRAAHAARLRAFEAERTAIFRRANVETLTLTAGRDITDTLMRFFKAREKRIGHE